MFEIFDQLVKFLTPAPEIQVGTWSIAKDRHVVYSPFPAITGVRKLGTSWEPHDKYIVVRHGDMKAALGFVKDGQTVYIVCHCNAKATRVADNARNKLTAQELASRVEKDGLSKHIRRVKLYACSGGAGGVDSFASQFVAEMRLLGYADCEFYAYLSTVYSLNAQTGRKLAMELDENGKEVKGKYVRASCMRIKVDG